MRIGSLGGWGVGLLLSIASLGAAGSDLQLVEAMKARDATAVRALLAQGVEVDAPQGDGATALHWAAYWDEAASVDLLLRAGANVNAANDYGVTPLSLACLNGSAAMVEKLLTAGADPNALDSSGVSPVMTAARVGSVAVVETLLAHGADIHARESTRGQTALMWAVAEKHPDVVRVLLERGADVNARSRERVGQPNCGGCSSGRTVEKEGGFTPLLFAARAGDVESVRLLLGAGANVNEVSEDGLSPLLVATVRGHVVLAELLLENGADPNWGIDPSPANGLLVGSGAGGTSGVPVQALPGFTALHWAAGGWVTDFMYAAGKRGISPEDDAEWSAVFGLRGVDRLNMIAALLEHGADPNARLMSIPPQVGYAERWDRKHHLGATPLLLAATATGMGFDAEAMRILVAYGADPRIVTGDNTTVLMAAAGVQSSEVTPSAQTILEAVTVVCGLESDGCSPALINAVNAGGDTALHGAARYDDGVLAVQFLLEKGAEVNVTNDRGQTPLYLADHYIHPGTAPVPRESEAAALLRKWGAEPY